MNTLDWLSQLVAFDTTSRNSNMQLIEMVDDYLRQNHITTRFTYDPSEPKANLFATIPAQNGNLDWRHYFIWSHGCGASGWAGMEF